MNTPDSPSKGTSISHRIDRPTLSEIVRKPERPLGPLSDFVVVGMPLCLKNIRNNTQGSAEAMTQEVAELMKGIDFERLTVADLKIAWMDLGFLEAAFGHSGLEVPPELKVLMDTCADRLDNAPTLTYEGYILINPLDDDPRLFLDEETGAEHELFFCQIHAEIEKILKPLFDMLMAEYGGEAAEPAKFADGVRRMGMAKDLMGCLLQHFSTEKFQSFRAYLLSNKDRQLAGASGAFSAAFPALDQILLDEALRPLPEESANPRLWPRKNLDDDWYISWSDIFAAKARRPDRALLLSRLSDSGLKAQVIALLSHLNIFRGKHVASVKKFLPEIWTGRADSTGAMGEFYTQPDERPKPQSPVREFLVKQKGRVKDTIDNLKSGPSKED